MVDKSSPRVEVLPIEQGATIDLNNVNKHTAKGRKLVENSLSRRGAFRSIASAGKNAETPVVYAGNLTLQTAVEAGFKEIVNVHVMGDQLVNVVRDDVEPGTAEAIALGLEDNESNKQSYNPDIDILAALAADPILDALRKEDKVFGGMLEGMGLKDEAQDAEPQIDRAEELREKWGVQSGDLWQIGSHRLLCGDSTKREDVEWVMGGEKAELAPVDPPYNVGIVYDGETVDDQKTHENYEIFCRSWFAECQNVSKRQIVTPGCYNLAWWARWFEPYHIGPWLKNNSMTNGKVSRFWCWEPVFFFGDKWKRTRHDDIYDYPVGTNMPDGSSFTGLHPCPKPPKMWQELVDSYSELGDIVFDCFCGTGTTIVACENLGRKCRAIEISPAYVAVTLERMATAFPGIEIKRL